MGWFKSKEEKEEILKKELKKELEEFLLENEEYFNYLCFDGEYVVVYVGAKIKHGEVWVDYKTHLTPDGFVSSSPHINLQLSNNNFPNYIKRQRVEFLLLEKQLEKFGVKLVMETK